MIFKYHSKGQGDVIIGGWVSIVHNWIYIFIKTPHPEKWMLCTIILKQAIIKKKVKCLNTRMIEPSLVEIDNIRKKDKKWNFKNSTGNDGNRKMLIRKAHLHYFLHFRRYFNTLLAQLCININKSGVYNFLTCWNCDSIKHISLCIYSFYLFCSIQSKN